MLIMTYGAGYTTGRRFLSSYYVPFRGLTYEAARQHLTDLTPPLGGGSPPICLSPTKGQNAYTIIHPTNVGGGKILILLSRLYKLLGGS